MVMRFSLGAVLLGIALTLTSQTANADETILTDCQDACDNKVTAELELMFLRPHASGGYSRDNIFGYELAPRFRIGYETARGAGVRFQYWGFSHSTANGDNGMLSSLDTYNLDADIFKRIGLGTETKVEVSAGIRYNDYQDRNVADDGQFTSFSGWGGFLGAQVWHNLGFGVSGFARGKMAILMDNGTDNGVTDFDVIRSQQEIALGLERRVSLGLGEATLRSGLEWQDWGQFEDDANGSLGFGGYFVGLNFDY